jgi:hypothetical protein
MNEKQKSCVVAHKAHTLVQRHWREPVLVPSRRNAGSVFMKKILLVCLGVGVLAGCGGGGSGGQPSSDTQFADVTELEGKWVYSSDGHITGAGCGRDASGELGSRVTYTFTKNKYVIHLESCMGSGAVPQYVFMSGRAGDFVIGGSFTDNGAPGYQLRALDLLDSHGNRYTSYQLQENRLTLASKSDAGHDGRTPVTRQIGFESPPSTFIKQ